MLLSELWTSLTAQTWSQQAVCESGEAPGISGEHPFPSFLLQCWEV